MARLTSPARLHSEGSLSGRRLSAEGAPARTVDPKTSLVAAELDV